MTQRQATPPDPDALLDAITRSGEMLAAAREPGPRLVPALRARLAALQRAVEKEGGSYGEEPAALLSELLSCRNRVQVAQLRNVLRERVVLPLERLKNLRRCVLRVSEQQRPAGDEPFLQLP